MAEVTRRDGKWYAKRIVESWRSSVEAIIQTGRLLAEAKEKLPHGAFEKMIEEELPFGPRTARYLLTIGDHPMLSDRNHGSVLPPSWRTLSVLARLDAATLASAVTDGTIHPDMTRAEASKLLPAKDGGGEDGNMLTQLNRLSNTLDKWIDEWPASLRKELVVTFEQAIERLKFLMGA